MLGTSTLRRKKGQRRSLLDEEQALGQSGKIAPYLKESEFRFSETSTAFEGVNNTILIVNMNIY
jgi:hypothetical protein